MKVEDILARLDGVRAAGPVKWVARCPAHDDKTPSLSIRDVGDRFLLHCFGGCSFSQVIAALGLVAHELFADGKPVHQCAPGVTKRKLADELEIEFLILAQCMHVRSEGKQLDEIKTAREKEAWRRVDLARKYL